MAPRLLLDSLIIIIAVSYNGPPWPFLDTPSIEGLGRGMWKDFVAINGSERALICIATDDPLGGGRRDQSSALTPTPNRLYGSDSKSY